jgi:hypothetical protein
LLNQFKGGKGAYGYDAGVVGPARGATPRAAERGMGNAQGRNASAIQTFNIQ